MEEGTAEQTFATELMAKYGLQDSRILPFIRDHTEIRAELEAITAKEFSIINDKPKRLDKQILNQLQQKEPVGRGAFGTLIRVRNTIDPDLHEDLVLKKIDLMLIYERWFGMSLSDKLTHKQRRKKIPQMLTPLVGMIARNIRDNTQHEYYSDPRLAVSQGIILDGRTMYLLTPYYDHTIDKALGMIEREARERKRPLRDLSYHVVDACYQIALTTKKLHENNTYYRDFKPANILCNIEKNVGEKSLTNIGLIALADLDLVGVIEEIQKRDRKFSNVKYTQALDEKEKQIGSRAYFANFELLSTDKTWDPRMIDIARFGRVMTTLTSGKILPARKHDKPEEELRARSYFRREDALFDRVKEIGCPDLFPIIMGATSPPRLNYGTNIDALVRDLKEVRDGLG